MKSEKAEGIETELRYGSLERYPIVAWAVDTNNSRLELEAMAVGDHAVYVNNRSDKQYTFIPATPGFYEMYYVVNPFFLPKLSKGEAALHRKDLGTYLGRETPCDVEMGANEWMTLAIGEEQQIFIDLIEENKESEVVDAN
jgi:hypothetical protein